MDFCKLIGIACDYLGKVSQLNILDVYSGFIPLLPAITPYIEVT